MPATAVVGDDRRARGTDYRLVRQVAALSIAAAIVLTVLIDAVSPDFEASPLVLTVLGAVLLALVGLEAGDIMRGPRP